MCAKGLLVENTFDQLLESYFENCPLPQRDFNFFDAVGSLQFQGIFFHDKKFGHAAAAHLKEESLYLFASSAADQLQRQQNVSYQQSHLSLL